MIGYVRQDTDYFVAVCDVVNIPWHSVDADLGESPLLDLSDTVDNECRQTGNRGGTEGCQVSIL